MSDEAIIARQKNTFYRVSMSLKLLRIIHYFHTVAAIQRVVSKLQDIYYLHRYMLQNVYSWMKAGLKFLLYIHYFSCGLIMVIGKNDPTFIDQMSESSRIRMETYWNSFYVITQTITTVGYGD